MAFRDWLSNKDRIDRECVENRNLIALMVFLEQEPNESLNSTSHVDVEHITFEI